MFDLRFVENRIRKLSVQNSYIRDRLKNLGYDLPTSAEYAKDELPNFETAANSLRELKIACVMDRFTLDCYRHECNLLELTPEAWESEIEAFKPDMLFIESAWEGKNKLWYRKIANGSKEFFEMATYCQDMGIPIVFWNKEDPVYTDTFMPVARMADAVFTTDIDCVKRYKTELGHNKVYLLHFGAQPFIHNPIEKYERKEKFCFAGAYYHRYKKRAEVFDKFAEVFIETKGYDIYDRNYKSALPEHAFPAKYNKFILGKLDPSEIDIAYKGYYYGINMNSVNQSQTMFARRVFEMLASNTVTIGNYSRGVKNLFGDLTICTDDSTEMERQLNLYCNDETTSRKYRLHGLRSVLSQHLYEDRLDYIISKIFKKSLKKQLPKAVLFAYGEKGIESFKKQSYPNKALYVIGEKNLNEGDIIYLNKEKLSEILPSSFENSFVGVLDERNYYGKNYLLDMMLTLRYGDFDGIAKGAYYCYENGSYALKDKEIAYKGINEINLSKGIVKSRIMNIAADEMFEMNTVTCDNGISVDEFNYCENYIGDECCAVDDLNITDCGIPMREIEKAAEAISSDRLSYKGVRINGNELMALVKGEISDKLEINCRAANFEINSELGRDESAYIYFEGLYNVSDYLDDNNISLQFNCIGGMEVIGVCVFYDENKNKVNPAFTKVNSMVKVNVSQEASYFKLGLRIRGGGNIRVKEVLLGMDHAESGLDVFLSRSNVIILTNHYPEYADLYRNMFVHKRVASYKEDGFVYDIMRMNIYAKNNCREFEGINVIEGHGDVLEGILNTGKIDTVCVHFLDRPMWEVLKKYKGKIKIIIWSHGSDIQPWWRRKFIFSTEEELEKGKKDSQERMRLWKEVFSVYKEFNVCFVFVSQYAANITMEDYEIALDKDDYRIIHNYIDNDLFKYSPKNADSRKNIVSVRPFSSSIYGNDLIVQTILELSKKKFFKDLSFTIKGNGPLFDEILKPLKKFRNVSLEKTFLRQCEIVGLYKKNGIVLIPTRGDTQGVSRDEAMSCGLVPITNAVSAIPEFVDENCGMLLEGEDSFGMAQAIEKLYNNPSEFLRLSENAAKRVRMQSSKEHTIYMEEILINSKFNVVNDNFK